MPGGGTPGVLKSSLGQPPIPSAPLPCPPPPLPPGLQLRHFTAEEKRPLPWHSTLCPVLYHTCGKRTDDPSGARRLPEGLSVLFGFRCISQSICQKVQAFFFLQFGDPGVDCSAPTEEGSGHTPTPGDTPLPTGGGGGGACSFSCIFGRKCRKILGPQN